MGRWRKVIVKNKNNRRYLAGLIGILALLPAGLALAQPIDELDLLDKNTVRTERAIHSSKLALWTLPFETTQFVPNAPTPEMQAAMAAQQSGRYLEAIDLLEKSNDTRADLQLLRASYYLQGDQPRLAEDILAAVLKTSPGLAEAQALMAMSYLQRGKLEAAGQTASAALASGNSPLTARVASYALQAQGMLAEASALMAKENASGAVNALNLAREAELALSLGDAPRAQPLVARAREIAPDSPYVMAVSGLVWLISDQPASAQRAFEIALKRDSEDPKTLLGLGLAEARQGRLEQSIAHMRKAADSDPSSAVIQTYLGRALQQTGHVSSARKAFEAAIKLDPNDPAPRIYLAQLLNESGQPAAALQGLREAEKLKSSRGAYRGENLLNEDAQTLQANLAATYTALGMQDFAWRTLADGAGEKNAQNLKNQAEVLQGQRYAENARRSLVLQSLFNDDLDALPVTLDIYGDGGGQTGTQTPQQGAIGGLSGQQITLGDYGALFEQPDRIKLNALAGNRQTWGEQVRLAIGNEKFSISFAQLHYQTDGFVPYDDLNNSVWQTTLKWDPQPGTRVFLNYQNFSSERGAIFVPQDPFLYSPSLIQEESWSARLGLRQKLSNDGELSLLLSRQHMNQTVHDVLFDFDSLLPDSNAVSGEIQYRKNNKLGLLTLGVYSYSKEYEYFTGYTDLGEYLIVPLVAGTTRAKQLYAYQPIRLDEHWDMDIGLGWGWIENEDKGGTNDTKLDRPNVRLGFSYTSNADTRLRLALGQGINLPSVGGATLEPVETAGMFSNRQSDTGRLVRSLELSGEQRLTTDWLLSGHMATRNMHKPVGGITQELHLYRQQEGQVALHWLPVQKVLSVSLSAGIEKREAPDQATELDSISWQQLTDVKLGANWMINSNWSARAEVSRNWVEGQYQQVIPPKTSFDDASNQVNASLRWKHKQGGAELGVRNLTDDHFEYTETDPLAPRFSKGRFVYGNVSLNW